MNIHLDVAFFTLTPTNVIEILACAKVPCLTYPAEVSRHMQNCHHWKNVCWPLILFIIFFCPSLTSTNRTSFREIRPPMFQMASMFVDVKLRTGEYIKVEESK